MKVLNSGGVLGRLGDVVYQRVKPGLGNVAEDPTRSLQVRRYVPNHPGNSPAQAVQRSKFAGATAAWRALTAEQKMAWNDDAKGRGVSGWNLFISAWMMA